jgi:hypothetical protein
MSANYPDTGFQHHEFMDFLNAMVQIHFIAEEKLENNLESYSRNCHGSESLCLWGAC